MAAAFTPFAPLAVNAAGQALGFLGQVCDKAKAKIEEKGGIKQIATNFIKEATKPENLIKDAIIVAGAAVTIATCGAAGPLAAAGIAAAVGAVSAGANKLVTDKFDDGEINMPFREYAADMIGGAILGGVSAGLGTAVAKTGLSIIKGAAAMALTGSGTSALTQAIGTGEVDPKKVVMDGVLSGVSFYARAKLGDALKKNCFVAGTMIATYNGQKAIETLKAGDKVYAEDPETGEKSIKTVVQTFVHAVDTLVKVTINGEAITTTTEHDLVTERHCRMKSRYLRLSETQEHSSTLSLLVYF